jgi:hypothetical protein
VGAKSKFVNFWRFVQATTVGRNQPGQLRLLLGRRRIVSGGNRRTKSWRDACRCSVKCLVNASPGSRYQYAEYSLARWKPKAGGLFSKEREIVKNVVISWEQLVVMWGSSNDESTVKDGDQSGPRAGTEGQWSVSLAIRGDGELVRDCGG